MTTQKIIVNEDEQTIDFDSIDMESFEDGYKECLKEIWDWEEEGRRGLKVEILFTREGKFAGHVWENNCGYSKSDLEKMDLFRLDGVGEFAFEQLQIDWQEELRIELC